MRDGACIERIFSNDKIQEAIGWLQSFAEKGIGDTQVRLAVILRMGLAGTQPDPWDAFKWAKRAAEMGLPIGHYYLGDCYWSGSSTTTNIKLAIDEWKIGASLGEIYSQMALGEHYGNGDAAPYLQRDPAQAYLWYNIASANPQAFLQPDQVDRAGLSNRLRATAAKNRDTLRPLLTDEQFREVERQSAEWSRLHPIPDETPESTRK